MQQAVGKLEAIWIKRVRRGKMDPARQAELVAGKGIVGNANQGGRRQVTIIDKDVWAARTAEVGATLDPSARRANLMISGVDLLKSRGKTLRIGECILEIAGETKPCERMEEAAAGLRAAMYPDWGGGAFAMIVKGGTIKVGDDVEFYDPVLL
jgi:MOSC domain-containing protein YiiM